MTADRIEPALRPRVIAAALLAVCALLLSAAEYASGLRRTSAHPAAGDADVAAVLDTLFAQEGIAAADVKTWRATAAGRPSGRIEQRVNVGPEFISIRFNHELSLRLAPLGARVVGTERTKEQVVTMHIIRGGTTIRSVACVAGAGQ